MPETTWLEVKISKDLCNELLEFLRAEGISSGEPWDEDTDILYTGAVEDAVAEALRDWIDSEKAALETTERRIREAELQIAANAAKMREDTEMIRKSASRRVLLPQAMAEEFFHARSPLLFDGAQRDVDGHLVPPGLYLIWELETPLGKPDMVTCTVREIPGVDVSPWTNALARLRSD